MALDHDALQPQQHPAIGLVGIELVAQRLEGLFREQVADPGAPGPRHRAAKILAHLPRGSLGCFNCDIAGEAFGDNDVRSALADAVALDEADECKVRQVQRAQQLCGLAHRVDTLDLLGSNI